MSNPTNDDEPRTCPNCSMIFETEEQQALHSDEECQEAQQFTEYLATAVGEIEAMQETFKKKSTRLAMEYGRQPLGPLDIAIIRLESLIELVLPNGTPDRIVYEHAVSRKRLEHLDKADQELQKQKLASITPGKRLIVPGN